MQQVAAGALRTGNVVQAAHVEDADGVGRPRRREVEAGTHLRQVLLVALRVQERLVGEPLRVVALAQQPGQHLCIMERRGDDNLLLGSEVGGNLEIVAELRLDTFNLLRHALLCLSQETLRGSLGETRHTVVMDNNLSTGENMI